MSSIFVSVTPVLNARVGVSEDIVITYSFDSGATMWDDNTVIVANIIFEEIVSGGDDIPTAFAVSLSVTDTVITINPTESLKTDTNYKVSLTALIVDDNAVAVTPKSFNFITSIVDETPTPEIATDGNPNKVDGNPNKIVGNPNKIHNGCNLPTLKNEFAIDF